MGCLCPVTYTGVLPGKTAQTPDTVRLRGENGLHDWSQNPHQVITLTESPPPSIDQIYDNRKLNPQYYKYTVGQCNITVHVQYCCIFLSQKREVLGDLCHVRYIPGSVQLLAKCS